jgi:hypothetical protein
VLSSIKEYQPVAPNSGTLGLLSRGTNLHNLIRLELPGCQALEFVRETPFTHDTIECGIEDVRRAEPNARLIEATLAPSLSGVGLP